MRGVCSGLIRIVRPSPHPRVSLLRSAEPAVIFRDGLAVRLRYRLGNDSAHLFLVVQLDLAPQLDFDLLEHREHVAVLLL